MIGGSRWHPIGGTAWIALAAIPILSLVWSAAAASANFQINTVATETADVGVSVAAGVNEKFIAAWAGASAGTDSSGDSIQARRYDADGQAEGGQFQVNSFTSGEQYSPSVAIGLDGSYLVVWTSEGSSGSDTSGESVQGQLYDAGGSALGGEFQVNTYTTGFQGEPAVATGGDGRFIVVYRSEDDIRGQRYDAAALTFGSEFLVGSSVHDRDSPAVAAGVAGEFVVSWTAAEGVFPDGYSIYAQRFSNEATALGPDFKINTSMGFQAGSAIAVGPDGGFVVAWDDTLITEELGQGCPPSCFSLEYNARARLYDSAGLALGPEFTVNTAEGERFPSIAFDPQGEFVVAWSAFLPSVKAKLFAPDGTPLTQDLAVESKSSFAPEPLPAVAVTPEGRIFVAYNLSPDDPPDALNEIWGLVYAPPASVPGLTWAAVSALGLALAGLGAVALRARPPL